MVQGRYKVVQTAMYCEANFTDIYTDYSYLNILGGLEFTVSLQMAGNQSGHAGITCSVIPDSATVSMSTPSS